MHRFINAAKTCLNISLPRSRRKSAARHKQFSEPLEPRLLLTSVPFGASIYDSSEYMIGDVYVTVVFLESDGSIDSDTETWTASQIESTKARITEGITWWEDTFALENSVHELNFQIDFTHADNPVEIPYEPISRPVADSTIWIESALTALGFDSANDNNSNRDLLNHHQRINNDANWAFTMFIANAENDEDNRFANGTGTISSPRGQIIAGSERSALSYANTVGNVFYALNEWRGGADYETERGYYSTQNTNAFDGNPNPENRVPSLMADSFGQSFENNLCSQPCKEMVGWKDSDGDGIFDVLDVPLRLEGTSNFDSAAGIFHFQGESWVQTLENQNPRGLSNDITLNTVSRLQYKLDDGEWIDLAGTVDPGQHKISLDFEIHSIPADTESIRLQTIADESGSVSNTISLTTSSLLAIDKSSSVNGDVWLDLNNDGIRNSDEGGLAGIPIKLRNPDGSYAVEEFTVEPDDYDHRTLLNSISRDVSFSAFGTDLFSDEVFSHTTSATTTGTRSFFHRIESGLWNSTWGFTRRLRLDFQEAVNRVTMDVFSPFENGVGKLIAFNTNDEIVDQAVTTFLGVGETATLNLSTPDAEIAYVVSDGVINSSTVRFDNLRVATDAAVTSDELGTYSFSNIEPGTYLLQAESIPGRVITSPGPAEQTVNVTNEEPASQSFLAVEPSIQIHDDSLLLSQLDEGASSTIQVRLQAPPSEPVTLQVGFDKEARLSTAIESLEFTTANWNEYQDITLTAIDNKLFDGDEAISVSISIDPAASDSNFAEMLPASKTITAVDNDVSGNVDGDADFDANDSFLIQLVMLAGANSQIEASKGASQLSAQQIRSLISQLGGDVDGDNDIDANDAFLIHLVKLAGTDTQIDQSKGISPLSAAEIRARIESLTPPATGQSANTSDRTIPSTDRRTFWPSHVADTEALIDIVFAGNDRLTTLPASEFRSWINLI